jgi:TPR repeat protein
MLANANCLDIGQGVKQDKTLAAYDYKLSADAGHSRAMFLYGLYLDIGKVVPQDEVGTAYYYKQSADAGNSEAMVSYGLYLDIGKDPGKTPQHPLGKDIHGLVKISYTDQCDDGIFAACVKDRSRAAVSSQM